MLKLRMKQMGIVLLGVFLMLSFVACGGKNTVGSNNGEKAMNNTANDVKETNSVKEEQENTDIYPITIKSEEYETIIKKFPEKAVVFGYENAEFMAALGLEDKIKYFYGGHQTIDDVLPQYKEQLKRLENLEGNSEFTPSLEHMLDFEPDVIILPSYIFFVEGFGTKEDYAKNNIPIYVLEGTYVPNCTIENTYNDIINVGKIFNKEKEAIELVDSMKKRISAVDEKMKDKKELKVLAFDSELNGNLVTWGGTGLANSLLTRAKGENVFSSIDKQFPQVSWEEIVNSNPDIIVIDAYENDNQGQAKIDLLKNNPLTAELDAVKNDRFLIIPLFSIFPGLQNVDVVEKISEEVLKAQ